MIDILNFGRLGRRFLAGLTLCAAAIGHAVPAFAQAIAGTYVLLGDSDGTKPKAGAKLELSFSGGVVKLFAVRPGETVRDTGTYSIAAHQITIHFKEVDWAADHQPYSFDGCTLTLPFMAVSSASGPGTSSWQREAPKCAGQPASAVQGQLPKPKFSPFSADEVITAGDQHRTIRVYATENALRSESLENGQDTVTIMRFDRNVVWTLTPQTRSLAETSLNFGAGSSPLQQSPVGPDCKAVGNEQIGAYLCSKVLCHATLGGHDYTETQWSAQALGGLIIKYTDGVQTLELQNIKLEPPDPKLFEIPPGYQEQSSK
ncbi:MAG TPA: hypothetical protein VI685_19970 [Candidatus Angelobacter sp.]